MSKELVIGSNRHETKVAILEEDQLVEVYFQRANEYSLAGSVHKGRVTRVLPGMQSAFVDLGLERDTFLYVSDFFEEHDDIDTVAEEKPVRTERRDRNPAIRQVDKPDAERISEAPSETGAADTEGGSLADEAHRPMEQATPVSPVVVRPILAGAGSTRPVGEQASEGNFRDDRRGRRPRRRRQRGQGFPENKYAQATGSSPIDAKEPVIASAHEETTGAIVLPGESLAKYRHMGAEAASADDSSHRAAAPEQEHPEARDDRPDPGWERAETRQESDEELASEAEEIALTDRIFGHYDEENPEAESERRAEVGAETTISVFGTPVTRPSAAEPATSESRVVSSPLKAEDTIEIGREPSDATVVLPIEPLDLDEEVDLLSVDDDLSAPVDESLPDNALPTGDERAPAEDQNATATPSEEPSVQTAVVREQGGRSMHRVSRRMRRRRGGNRFGNAPSQTAATSEAKEIEATGAANGAGAALAPEPRREVRREQTQAEDRDVEKAERIYPSISDLLKPGQEIIVQIAKEPLGQKGARITSHIALPGRYVVFMPSVTHLGVSRKVASDEERQRLKRILQAHRAGTTGGFIVRTAGEGVPEDEIAADMTFLYSLWLDIRQKAEKKPAPALLHYDLDIVQRILRDQVTEEFKAIWVDNEDLYENVVNFMQRFQPSLVARVKMYTRKTPIFDAFNITQELEKALRPKVWLKSGGYIVINQTEALVAIDINTGKYVGKSNRLEDTIVKTNTEAVKEIVRQIRLRDLGGIIVVDFIDMDERKNRQKVMQALEEAMRADKAPYKILQFNDFGLVAITRKRVKQSLERTLCAPCPYCEAAGYVKSVQTVVSEILVEAQKISGAIEGKDVVLRVNPEVAKLLKASSNQYLEELEEILDKPVLVTGDPTLHHQKFDLG